MTALRHVVAICALCLLTLSCAGSKRRCQDAPLPLSLSQAVQDATTYRSIATLVGEPPAVGTLPRALAFAPDSRSVSYERDNAQGAQRFAELWLYEVNGRRDRPLFTDPSRSVAFHAWCGPSLLLVAAGNELFLIAQDGTRRTLGAKTDAAVNEAACSPDGAFAAASRDGELWIYDLKLEPAESWKYRGASATERLGDVTWLYQEELGTTHGLGWSPNGQRLWFYATELAFVPQRALLDVAGVVHTKPYPRPGEKLPVVRVGVLELGALTKTGRAPRVAPKPMFLSTGQDQELYIPQVVWHPSSGWLVVTRLDRLQTLAELVRCEAASGACSPLLEERDPRWVNLQPEVRFAKGGAELYWISERTGFAQIHRFGADGHAMGLSTTGEWVVSSIDAVNDDEGRVYFTANADKPYAYGLYRARIDGSRLERVSPDSGCHRVLFSPDGKLFVDTHSALDRPPRTELFTRDGERLGVLDAVDLRPYTSSRVMNDIFAVEQERGAPLYALLTRPEALQNTARYPVLVLVYGGPQAQLVRDEFRPIATAWRNLLAATGILVFSIDGRGSAGRGREFEAPIHGRLGEVEIVDQLVGVAYLKTLPFVDRKRIGIMGASYGGTLTLEALLETDGVFKAGVAVAPVTDWREYDSIYTERYLQRPADNPKGYARDIVSRAAKLHVPLLLAHGLADDNVYFSHSARLLRALIQNGRRFETAFYPGEAHVVRGDARIDLYFRITRFLKENL